LPSDDATTLLAWPVATGDFPAFGPGFGPEALVLDLVSGHRSARQIPQIAGCDCLPYLIAVGSRVVYAGDGGTAAIPATLTAKPRLLGATGFFVPSATPGRIWLVWNQGGRPGGQGRVQVRQVAVMGGPAGPVLTMPADTGRVISGTDNGFLLEVLHGTHEDLVLWRPGGVQRMLPDMTASDAMAGISAGVDATARVVAYGTRCDTHTTAATKSGGGNTGYEACEMLRVLDVATGKLTSYGAPPGTSWEPNGFNTTDAISPDDQMVAAYAVQTGSASGQARLYVVSLRSGRTQLVPSSQVVLAGQTAWSATGSWLLYQGRGGHLWAYQMTSGKIRESSTPCCQYTVMVATPTHSG